MSFTPTSGEYQIAAMPNSLDLAMSLLRRAVLRVHILHGSIDQPFDMTIRSYEGDLITSPWKLVIHGAVALDREDDIPMYVTLYLYSDHPRESRCILSTDAN